jgi:hypothetical protein
MPFSGPDDGKILVVYFLPKPRSRPLYPNFEIPAKDGIHIATQYGEIRANRFQSDIDLRSYRWPFRAGRWLRIQCEVYRTRHDEVKHFLLHKTCGTVKLLSQSVKVFARRVSQPAQRGTQSFIMVLQHHVGHVHDVTSGSYKSHLYLPQTALRTTLSTILQSSVS